MNMGLWVAVAGLCVVLYAITRPQRTHKESSQQNVQSLTEVVLLLDKRQNHLLERIELLESTLSAIRETAGSTVIEDISGRDKILPVTVNPAPEEDRSLGQVVSPLEEAQQAPIGWSITASAKYARAFALRQQGLEIEDIAKATGIGTGEIELVFGLANQGERS